MSISVKKKIPMLLTYSRMVVVIPILALLGKTDFWSVVICTILFILGSVTDYFDGWLARRWDAVSIWGKLMDPVADKILVTGVLVALVGQGWISSWLVILLLTRDTWVAGIRSVAAASGLIIDAKPTGKWKTAVQMVAIPALILGSDNVTEFPFYYLRIFGISLLWVSVLLSLKSGVEYYFQFRNTAQEQK